MFEVESVDGRKTTVEDPDLAAYVLLELRGTRAVRWRSHRGRSRDLTPDELADLRHAVRFQREARQRLAERPSVPEVPAG
jgi:hypothetical protein